MKKKYIGLGIAAALLVTGSVLFAEGVTPRSIGFFAPNVRGTTGTNVGTPESGAIVFNIDDSNFYGNAGTPATPSWVSMNAGAAAVPSGALLPFGGSTAPTGFLMCDGSAVSRTTYANLFAAIGTSFGTGDGSTTFNLPDLRGRFVRGWDSGAGNDPDSSSRTAIMPGGATGDNVGSLQADQFASHVHAVDGFNSAEAAGLTTLRGGGNGATGTVSSEATGGSETRPKNVNLNYIIKT